MNTTFFDRIKGYKTYFVNGLILLGGLAGSVMGGDVAMPTAEEVSFVWDQLFGGGAMVLASVNIVKRIFDRIVHKV